MRQPFLLPLMRKFTIFFCDNYVCLKDWSNWSNLNCSSLDGSEKEICQRYLTNYFQHHLIMIFFRASMVATRLRQFCDLSLPCSRSISKKRNTKKLNCPWAERTNFLFEKEQFILEIYTPDFLGLHGEFSYPAACSFGIQKSLQLHTQGN